MERMTVEPSPLELRAFTRQQIAQFDELARAKSITLTVNGSWSPVPGVGDVRIIETVLRNLVSNAIKFTPEGGSVAIDFEQHGAQIRLHVRDTGIRVSDRFSTTCSRPAQSHRAKARAAKKEQVWV